MFVLFYAEKPRIPGRKKKTRFRKGSRRPIKLGSPRIGDLTHSYIRKFNHKTSKELLRPAHSSICHSGNGLLLFFAGRNLYWGEKTIRGLDYSIYISGADKILSQRNTTLRFNFYYKKSRICGLSIDVRDREVIGKTLSDIANRYSAEAWETFEKSDKLKNFERGLNSNGKSKTQKDLSSAFNSKGYPYEYKETRNKSYKSKKVSCSEGIKRKRAKC